jgi:hypothetical protein
VRDLEIGQPINSEQRSETADDVTRESEGRTRLPLLHPLRQDQPRGYSGARLCSAPLQQGRAGRGSSGLSRHRGDGVARWLGACAQAGDLPTGPYQTRVHTEGQLAGSGLHDPPLAMSPGRQRPQQRLAVDRIGLGAPMPPVDRDRSRVDGVALDPVGKQQAMN